MKSDPYTTHDNSDALTDDERGKVQPVTINENNAAFTNGDKVEPALSVRTMPPSLMAKEFKPSLSVRTMPPSLRVKGKPLHYQ